MHSDRSFDRADLTAIDPTNGSAKQKPTLLHWLYYRVVQQALHWSNRCEAIPIFCAWRYADSWPARSRIQDGGVLWLVLTENTPTRRYPWRYNTTTTLRSGHADMRSKAPTDWFGPKLLSLLAVSAPPPWKIWIEIVRTVGLVRTVSGLSTSGKPDTQCQWCTFSVRYSHRRGHFNVVLFSVGFNHGRATHSPTDVYRCKMLAANSPIYSFTPGDFAGRQFFLLRMAVEPDWKFHNRCLSFNRDYMS